MSLMTMSMRPFPKAGMTVVSSPRTMLEGFGKGVYDAKRDLSLVMVSGTVPVS